MGKVRVLGMATSIDLTMCFFFFGMIATVVISAVGGSGLMVERRSKCMALIEETILGCACKWCVGRPA